MGEAKRRKQLGLMPTIHHFEVRQDGEKLVLVSGPQDSALCEKIMAGMQDALGHQHPWPQQYRREYVMAGRPQKLLRTAADVAAIPVPQHRRWQGELLENYDPKSSHKDLDSFMKVITEYYSLDAKNTVNTRGTWLHFRDEFSFDGNIWESFPESDSPFSGLRYLMQHPVTDVKGELVAEYRHEHTIDGVQTFDPEPPAEHRKQLESMMANWNGKTPDEWTDIYYETKDIYPVEAEEGNIPIPKAIRSVIELRQAAPLPGIQNIAIDQIDGLNIFIPYESRQISFDNGVWEEYTLTDEYELEGLNMGGFGLGDIIGVSRLDTKELNTKVWMPKQLTLNSLA